MVRHPSELFIKFVMTLPNQNATTDSWVAGYIGQLGFPEPELAYMGWLRAQMAPKLPDPFFPTNKFDPASVKFLKEEKIYGLHHPDVVTQECFKILTDFRARPMIEDFLLGRMDPKEVARKVNARLSAFFLAEVIETYGHYFWNCTLLKVDEWSYMLREVDHRRQHTLSILQVGPAMALHKHGFSQQIESKTILKEMQESVYFDFRDWKAQPRSTKKTRALSVLARAAIGIDERLAQADSALKESLAAFERFRMKQSEHQVKSITELAPEGNFTGSGAKLIEAKVAK